MATYRMRRKLLRSSRHILHDFWQYGTKDSINYAVTYSQNYYVYSLWFRSAAVVWFTHFAHTEIQYEQTFLLHVIIEV